MGDPLPALIWAVAQWGGGATEDSGWRHCGGGAVGRGGGRRVREKRERDEGARVPYLA